MRQLQHKAVVSRPLDGAGATTSVWILRRRQDLSPLVGAFYELATGQKPNQSRSPVDEFGGT